MFQTKDVEKIKTFCFKPLFFENRAVYEIMWKNTVQTGRPQTTIWRKRIACRITKATHEITVSNTYCFATATMVYESASILRYL
jgi:hypothetical protein